MDDVMAYKMAVLQFEQWLELQIKRMLADERILNLQEGGRFEIRKSFQDCNKRVLSKSILMT